MSDKERLEEIKKELELYWSNIFYVVNQDDMKWLINRVEELGEENDELVERVHKLALDWSELVDENNELAERVGELKKEVSDWRAEVQKWQKFYKESEENHLETKELLKNLVNQNKRYREALKNIYEVAEYNEYDNILEQIVSEIEKALEGENNDG